MVTLEKELNKNILKNFVQIIENDKKRKIPVIKFVRQGFLFKLIETYSKQKHRVNFIGISGESASGKSTFVKTIIKKIKEIENEQNKSLLNFVSTDNYFNDISEKIKLHGSFDNLCANENFNPDAPSNFQLALMKNHFQKLANKENVLIPEYKIDGTGRSVKDAILVETAPIIMCEGIAVFYNDIKDLFDIKFYVEIDEETRLKRYIERAIKNRNQTAQDAVAQYQIINKSAEIYLRPQRKYADVIINGNANIDDISQIAEEFSKCF